MGTPPQSHQSPGQDTAPSGRGAPRGPHKRPWGGMHPLLGRGDTLGPPPCTNTGGIPFPSPWGAPYGVGAAPEWGLPPHSPHPSSWGHSSFGLETFYFARHVTGAGGSPRGSPRNGAAPQQRGREQQPLPQSPPPTFHPCPMRGGAPSEGGPCPAGPHAGVTIGGEGRGPAVPRELRSVGRARPPLTATAPQGTAWSPPPPAAIAPLPPDPNAAAAAPPPRGRSPPAGSPSPGRARPRSAPFPRREG